MVENCTFILNSYISTYIYLSEFALKVLYMNSYFFIFGRYSLAV